MYGPVIKVTDIVVILAYYMYIYRNSHLHECPMCTVCIHVANLQLLSTGTDWFKDCSFTNSTHPYLPTRHQHCNWLSPVVLESSVALPITTYTLILPQFFISLIVFLNLLLLLLYVTVCLLLPYHTSIKPSSSPPLPSYLLLPASSVAIILSCQWVLNSGG